MKRPRRALPPADMDVLVIGGGMIGMAAGVKLADAGFNYTIIEMSADLGGT